MAAIQPEREKPCHISNIADEVIDMLNVSNDMSQDSDPDDSVLDSDHKDNHNDDLYIDDHDPLSAILRLPQPLQPSPYEEGPPPPP